MTGAGVIAGAGPLAGRRVIADDVTDDARGKGGAGGGNCAGSLTVDVHVAADTTSAQRAKALRKGTIL